MSLDVFLEDPETGSELSLKTLKSTSNTILRMDGECMNISYLGSLSTGVRVVRIRTH